MNYIKEVVEKVLPIEIGEEFNIILNDGGYSSYNPFKFTKTALVDKYGTAFPKYIGRIITGEYKIEKIPFVPKVNNNYWTYACCGLQINIMQYIWSNNCFDNDPKLFGPVL